MIMHSGPKRERLNDPCQSFIVADSELENFVSIV